MPATADMTALPSMDDHKVGPGGQTFGQLKADVIEARRAFMAKLVTASATEADMDAYDAAVRLLEAAYVRVGLPYVAP